MLVQIYFLKFSFLENLLLIAGIGYCTDTYIFNLIWISILILECIINESKFEIFWMAKLYCLCFVDIFFVLCDVLNR